MDVEIDRLVDGLAADVSNWGRWGEDDELGTLNLITPAVRAAAGSSISSGEVISLAMPLNPDWPQLPGSGRFNCQHLMVATGTDALATGDTVGWADDAIAMSVHGHTHWDALSHVFHRGKMFNGRSAGEVTAAGARSNDIVPVARELVTRGVLVDIAPGSSLSRGHEIEVGELEAALERQRIELRSGDALLIRTGQLGRVRASSAWHEFSEHNGLLPSEPGIGPSCMPWLRQRGVAAIACDNWAVEVLRGAESSRLPVHELALVYMGLVLGEMFELDQLAERCAEDGRWDFLLAAGPLPIQGAVGGPVNPLAIR
jgi:kynurenine formamidase